LFANNPLPMWIYDLQTLRFLEVNDAAVAYYGYSRDEFLNMTLVDIHPPEDVPRLLQDVARERPVLQFSGHWRHRRKDGKGFDVRAALERAMAGHSLGILNLQERAALFDGELTIVSTPDRGTEVRAVFPLDRRENGA